MSNPIAITNRLCHVQLQQLQSHQLSNRLSDRLQGQSFKKKATPMYNKHTKTFPLQPQTDTIATHPQPKKKKEKEKMSAHKMPLPLSLMSPPHPPKPLLGGGGEGEAWSCHNSPYVDRSYVNTTVQERV